MHTSAFNKESEAQYQLKTAESIANILRHNKQPGVQYQVKAAESIANILRHNKQPGVQYQVKAAESMYNIRLQQTIRGSVPGKYGGEHV